MGQGEARTLVRGGCLRNNKQMFFDDNCREGKRTAESMLVKRSLVEAVPPASAPSEAQWWYVVKPQEPGWACWCHYPYLPEVTSVHSSSHKFECQYSCLQLTWKKERKKFVSLSDNLS